MSYDDPEHLECTCSHRALRPEEMVLYVIPRENGFDQMIFAKDCPLHGYEVIPASEDAENA
jgi:hypothetical protein